MTKRILGTWVVAIVVATLGKQAKAEHCDPALATIACPAEIKVEIFKGFEDDGGPAGGGAPYTDSAGTFTSPDALFATHTGFSWHPFGLTDFGAEITGNLVVASPGTYTFKLVSDDGSLLYIDGSLVVDNGGPHSPDEATGNANLTAGIHTFKVEFFECCGDPSGIDLILPRGVSYCTPTVRGVGDQKGSLLAFSKVEIKWDASGNLIQDTLLDVSNDADADGVEVQAYFINGDRQIEERHDMEGNVIEEFEPGWNTADCRFHLTKSQPHYWSAARGSSKCQPFTVLDDDGPGRLDPEADDGTRILRGFIVMWAVRFHDPALHNSSHQFGENGFWEEIRWNHLKGDAVIVNYELGSAWEYNAWAYQARSGETGGSLLDCTVRNPDGSCCWAEVVPGRLDLDNFQYDINFDELLLDFYASGSTGLSTTGVGVMVDTDLTLHSMDVDVRQDGDGPILTKAEFEIFNQNESKFSGTRRCICCWDQTLLSDYVRTVAVPNHFLRSKLGTDKGYARIDGVHSDECDYFDTCGISPRPTAGAVAGTPNGINFSSDTALAGVAFKILTFTGTSTNVEWAGGNLHGTGEQSSTIRYDVQVGSGEAHDAP